MSNKIEGVPEGWELVGIRRAKKGEYSIQGTKSEAKAWEFDSASVYPIVRKLPEPLKIEEGKYYRQADGKVVGPMRKWDRSASDQYNWTQNGGGVWNSGGERYTPSQRATGNIVAEVPVPYRPFASAEEFKPYRDKWIQRKPEEDGRVHGAFQTTSYSDEGCYAGDEYTSYADLLGWQFEDGTPCGIKQ